MIRYGISGLPPDDGDDAAFLDALIAQGHGAYELAFVHGFPWKKRRCQSFGGLAADRGVELSVHAPYFAVLTVDDEERRAKTLSALEHTMKLGRELGAHTIVAHTGHVRDRSPEELHDLVDEGLRRIEPKVRTLGVALGLETSGSDRAFGSLGDIAVIAGKFSFVRPVVDWAHVHAKSGGALVDEAAFASVIAFLRTEFPGWAIDPLHTQFTDNEFGPAGEIRHVAYGDGTIRAEPLAAAAVEAGLRMIVISEAKDQGSHDAILAALRAGEASARPASTGEGRPAGSDLVRFPEPLQVVAEDGGFVTQSLERSVRLSNLDKVMFPDAGYTKGDLIQYYVSIAPMLLPHLAGRALSLNRFPDGIDGSSFFEKQCPSHAPEWITKAPIFSSHRGEPIEFCTAPDPESLAWLANLGCIEMNAWLSRVQSVDRADFAVFDLDPQEGVSWEQVVYVAGLINVVLERLGLAGYPKTSGASGLHIYVPLQPEYEFARVRGFVAAVGRMVEAADPDTITMQWDQAKRGSRVFIDHNQNVGGKTMATVYSLRPVPAAQVSTPINWDELDTVNPSDFTIGTVWERLRQTGDLFAPVLGGGQRLEGAEAALGIDS